ncbi:MAG: hypothetical protein Q9201_002034 [Fulgogasparrea decipioides]
MAHSNTLQGISDSAPLKTANLQTLSYTKLVDGDEAECQSLLSSSKTDGFFYLDLSDWKSGQFVGDRDATDRILAEWFKKPFEEKAKTETLSDAHGYKRKGQQSGVIEGSRDGYESLRLGRNESLARSHLPAVVQENLGLFERFQFSAHEVVKTILSLMSDVCALKGPLRFEHHHQDDFPSKSALYFLHHPPTDGKEGLGQNIHTDAGTLTLLFTKQPGLQVLSPTSSEWEEVVAKPGCAVVNVGDTLRFLSNDCFRSAMHRVLPKGTEDRYSTAYFLRAADNAIFVGSDGKETTAEQWFFRKFRTFTLSREEQRKDGGVVFGGMEKALGVAV